MQENDIAATNLSNQSRVSSPAATGGAGTLFEQHVDAYWLAQLLVQGIPPILIDCSVAEVCTQTEHLGWHTDDFLIVGQNGAGDKRKLAGQVKRSLTISSADVECKKAIGDFWRDFVGGTEFSPVTDRLALVTRRGTNTLLEHFTGLLDCARASRDGNEFENRLATKGFISNKAVQYCAELCTIIGEIEVRSVSAAEIWPFLRVLHVLSLDLCTSTRQHEAMIKTLLIFTTNDSDPSGAADASWNTLLAIAGDGMAEARRFGRNDLPDQLRQRHSPVGAERAVLQALKDHTDPILRNIRSTIGNDLHLQRAALVQQVLEKSESAQVTLVSGPAGSGKSVIAKDAIALLSADYFAFAFRAEEFAQPHLDATLLSGQIPVSAAKLGAILAGQDRKVLLIESVERLLEKSTRDAFSDLLTLATNDQSLRIVLTCREYSTDLVRASFLASRNIDHSVVVIPQLDDVELAEVEVSVPALAKPLANPALRKVLRNPYFLDKALQISWSSDRPLPQSEREFRIIFWHQIVRADDHPAAGMPRRREEAFQQIAVQRARALEPYVTFGDLDASVIDRLRQDSLIVASDHSEALVAPAHDVLEDWAILQWIEERHLLSAGSFRALSESIGTYPAVRRSFRKWVAELIERDPDAADRLFNAAVTDSGVSAQFRDDTLVSLLRAPSSPAFLEKHVAELLANDRILLRRMIHLLRVACVAAPKSLGVATGYGSLFNAPDGPAWAPILRIVASNTHALKASERVLMLGLIEDWARGVGPSAPYPDGFEAVATIAYWTLPGFHTYRSEGLGVRTLKVIAKIPNADAVRFASLLSGPGMRDNGDHATDTLRGIIFTGLDGIPAARDLPKHFVSAATNFLLCSEADLQSDHHYGGSMGLEILFGLKEAVGHDYFPASAYRGPWVSLFQHHPIEALSFLHGVFNHSADWYAHPRVPDRVEPPLEIELNFADGTARKQWANPRLWNLYRGTSVGPYVLQSLLMALERWLLDVAIAYPAELDAILISLLRQSDTVAVTAVVASVATAFPHASCETLLVLLRSPECISLDRQRMANESHSPSQWPNLFPGGPADNKIYQMERQQEDARPHRRHDLEVAIANLQFGPHAIRTHEILDQHRAALPPATEQNDHHRVWRLAMHRMDVRQYSITEVAGTEAVNLPDALAAEAERSYIRFDPKDPEPDVKEMMDESAAKLTSMNSRAGLLMWALRVFNGEDPANHDPTTWRDRLVEARTLATTNLGDDESSMYRDGPGIVAAVCARDHWPDLSVAEREWCIDAICGEVMRQADDWNQTARIQRNNMSADRSCASVISVLIGRSLSEARKLRVRRAFVAALTHAVDEVRWYTVWGAARHLWAVDRVLAMRCVNALAMEATYVDHAREIEEQRPYGKRLQIDDIVAESASIIRERFWKAGAIATNAHEELDAADWFGAEATLRILAILSQVPTEQVAIATFGRAAHLLVESWSSDDDRNSDSRRGRWGRNFENESSVSQLLQDFVMRVPDEDAKEMLRPILDSVDRHTREIHSFVQGLISVEDRERNTQHFWLLWDLFADSVKRAGWVAWLDREHPQGSDVVSALFLGTWWKEDVRHWRSLEGHAYRVHTLFEELPPSLMVLDNYVRFLYQIGERSLPESFVRIARRLESGNAQRMLSNANTVFMLEVLLQRHVYGRPLELKRNADIRDAVLRLLDLLVENGSSAAFRMRDDFVTPA